MKYKGIDVSSYQPNAQLNWARLKSAGLSFAVIKYTEGTAYKNPESNNQCKGAKAAGIMTHAYHFLRANTETGVRREADFFAGAVKSCPVDGYLFADVEAASCNAGLTAAALTANVNAFLDQLAKNGFTKLGVYANTNWFTNYLKKDALRSGILIWQAQYSSAPPPGRWDIWQSADNGRFAGFAGNLDVNQTNLDALAVKSKSPAAPAPKVPAAPKTPTAPVCPYPVPTVNVKKGNTGNNVKWVQWKLNQHSAKLPVDGIFGSQTDAAVRHFQKSVRINADGIVGPVTRGKL